MISWSSMASWEWLSSLLNNQFDDESGGWGIWFHHTEGCNKHCVLSFIHLPNELHVQQHSKLIADLGFVPLCGTGKAHKNIIIWGENHPYQYLIRAPHDGSPRAPAAAGTSISATDRSSFSQFARNTFKCPNSWQPPQRTCTTLIGSSNWDPF